MGKFVISSILHDPVLRDNFQLYTNMKLQITNHKYQINHNDQNSKPVDDFINLIGFCAQFKVLAIEY